MDKKLEYISRNDSARIFELGRPYVNKNGNFTPELFLAEKGFLKPVEKTLEEIRTTFGKTLFFINSHKNVELMKQGLSHALSDEKDSMEFFEGFLEKVSS